MKKLISLLLIVVLMVSTLSSCSLFVDYTIYSSTVDSNDSSNSVAFEKADKIKFVSTLIGDYTEREDAPKEKKVKINGEEFSYNYYKTRKNEAVHKLEKEQQNLLRVDDIIGELEVQVGPLAEQSEKAKEYLRLKEHLKQAETAAFCRDAERIGSQLEKLEQDEAAANEQLAESMQKSETEKEKEKQNVQPE